LIEITGDNGSSTLSWDTYSKIMRERYLDGRRETWVVAVGSLEDAINATTDNKEITALMNAKNIITEAMRNHDSSAMG
jgi:hypothetical protein